MWNSRRSILDKELLKCHLLGVVFPQRRHYSIGETCPQSIGCEEFFGYCRQSFFFFFFYSCLFYNTKIARISNMSWVLSDPMSYFYLCSFASLWKQKSAYVTRKEEYALGPIRAPVEWLRSDLCLGLRRRTCRRGPITPKWVFTRDR